MKKLALVFPALVLVAACGGEPPAEPAPTATVAAPAEPKLPPPDQEVFSAAFAEACEGAEPVATAVCKRAMGASEVQCEYGLGEDAVLRYKAMLQPSEDGTKWALADAPKICAEHGA